MSWWWRTKPRSIIRTVQWFYDFGKLKGQNWNEKDITHTSHYDDSPVHPIRRQYIYKAHSGDDNYLNSLTLNKYLSGEYDKKETESNGRNDKITFEFFGFGYVDTKGIIKTTKVGDKILNDSFDDEDFLKQLLKLQFPNPITKGNDFDDAMYIYPMELILKAFERFDSLNRSEFVLLFGCNSTDKISQVLDGISKFKKEYDLIPNKNKTNDVKALCKKIYLEIYGKLDNDLNSYYDYAEALCRCLVYTGLFKASGRSLATKLRIPEYCKTKFELLLSSYKFRKHEFKDVETYMVWFGDTNNTTLPWENIETRQKIITEKLDYIVEMTCNSKNGKIADVTFKKNIDDNLKQFKIELKDKYDSYSDLKELEGKVSNFITGIREKEFIEFVSQTDEARKEILDMYDQILDTIDMGALWLEVNTWKSLNAIKGNKSVKRNFKIEEDLTPKSFAPGIGNTPDMEMYFDEYVIIPEVSLMTGVKQWEHEASSVIDHVLSFVDEYKDKKVRGLFLSSSLNNRTKWQFFILNKESWMSKPVPVIPMTINQYKSIINIFYKYNLDINEFGKLLDNIHKIALDSDNFENWFKYSDLFLNNWSNSFGFIS